MGSNPYAVAVNSATNKIYSAKYDSNDVSVYSDTTIDDPAGDIGDPSRRGVCAEGTIRPGFQMYLTIASEVNQTIRVDYLTNYGIVSHSQVLNGGVRYTENVNGMLPALLSGAGISYDPSGVDTSVKVTGAQRVYLACPLYFNAAIGNAGGVSGGHVQDSTRG